MAKKGRQNKVSQEVANPNVSSNEEFGEEISGTPKKQKKKNKK
ncbi:hypothetical protein [Fredinandcohnia sp. 179-A 10B2 NHS]